MSLVLIASDIMRSVGALRNISASPRLKTLFAHRMVHLQRLWSLVEADWKAAKLVCDKCFLCLPDLKALKAHTRQQHDYIIPHLQGPFQRDKHGKDGVPTCFHCDRRFPSWSHLERHIREHNCEVYWLKRQEAGLSPDQQEELPPLENAAQVATDGPSLPLARRAQVKSACLRDGWQSLLEDASLCAEMVNHCVICHQWVDQTQVKIHTRRVHPTEWQRFQADVTLECKMLARVAVSPCRWGGAVVKRTSEHSYKCSVAWQACFLGRLLTDESDGRGGRDERPCGGMSSPLFLPRQHRRGTGCNHRAKEPSGSRSTKERKRPPGRQRGSGSDNNQGRLTHHQPDLLDLLIKLVLRHEAFLGRLQQDMVYIFTFKNQPNAPDSLLPQEWREKYQTNPSSLDRSLRVTILLCLLTELLQRHRRLEANGAEEALKAIKGAGWMSEDGKRVHQVWNHAEAKLVTHEARGTMTLAEGTEHIRTMLELLAQPEILLKFAATRPLAQEMSGHQDFVHLRAVAEASGGGSDVCHDGEVGGQCNVAPGWIADSIIERTDFRACGPDTRKALQSVLRLVFVNTGNTCYMNSFCAATSWAPHS